MRRLLVSLTTLALLSVSGSAVTAQEASPDPGASPTPEQLALAEERLATATCLGKPATIVAIAGFETLGTSGADVIVGTDGDDIIRGDGGNDRICAGDGADLVEGGEGKDRIDGGLGNDRLDGGAGDDSINGGKGADAVLGAAGKDRLSGGAGDDVLNGGGGKDLCKGGPGHNRLPSCNERFRTRGTLLITRNTTLKGPHKGNIEIVASNVRLDCGGHTIIGLGTQDTRLQWGIGIFSLGRRGVTITDCHPREFGTGITVRDSKKVVIRHNSAVGNREGIYVHESKATVTANEAERNESWGFVVTTWEGGTNRGSILRSNTATENGEIGFLLATAADNKLIDNVAEGSIIGFKLNVSNRNSLTRNTAIGNDTGFFDDSFGGSGIADSRNEYADNTCPGNATPSIPAGLCDDTPPVQPEPSPEPSDSPDTDGAPTSEE